MLKFLVESKRNQSGIKVQDNIRIRELRRKADGRGNEYWMGPRASAEWSDTMMSGGSAQ
jgi:hypothetical protein